MNLEKTQRRGCRGGEKIRKGRRENGRKCALLPASGREQLAALRCQNQRLIVGWRLEVAWFVFQLIRTYVCQPRRKQ